MKRSIKRTVLDVMFLVVVFALTIYAVFHGQDLSAVLTNMKSADLRILLFPGVVFVIVFICCESLIIKYLFHSIGIYVRLSHCYLYSFIGFFFSCITPSASGGQPAQLYYMQKDKIPIPETTLVLFLVTITYKMVLVVVGAATLLFHPPKLMAALEPVMGWIWLGMALNVIGIVFMLVFVFHASFMHMLLEKGLCILEHFHIVKTKEEYHRKLNEMMEHYQTAANFFRANKRVVLYAFLLTVVQRFVLFGVTALTYLSFHLHGTSIAEILVLQCMISVSADMLPLPGGMGISEKLFLTIFRPAFGKGYVLPAMVLSRGISYYAQLFISAVMTIVGHFIIGKGDKNDRSL